MTQLDHAKEYLLSLQDRIVSNLEHLDGKARFAEDAWKREEGGGGRSRVLRNGGVFEQAGVNFSHVHGKQLPPSATKNRPDLAGQGMPLAIASITTSGIPSLILVRSNRSISE